MSDEIQKVLNMLDNGLIDVEDSIRLIQEINNNLKHKNKEIQNNDFDFESIYSVANELFSSVKDVVNDNILYKNNVLKNEFQKEVQGNIESLTLEGKNDIVTLESYAGDFIKLYFELIPKTNFKEIDFKDDGGNFILDYNSDEVNAMKIIVKIPESISINNLKVYNKNAPIVAKQLNTGNMELETKNSKIVLEKIVSKNAILKTKNSKIEIIDSNISNLEGSTSNGKIEIKDLKAIKALLITSNGKIDIENIDVHDISCSTSNTGIKIKNISHNNSLNDRNNKVSAITSNASIKIELVEKYNGIKVKAITTLGKIKSYYDNLNYFNKNFGSEMSIEGETNNYNDADVTTDIVAETSRGNIYLS